VWQGKRANLRHRGAERPTTKRPPMEPKFTQSAVESLRSRLQGCVVLAGDANYHLARQGFVVNYQAFPQIIVYCAGFSDVAAALEFARCWRLSPVSRAGGHSSAGYSVNNEIVIDVSQMSYVVVESERKRATVGAGTTFDRLNAALDTFGLHVPGGDCNGIGIAGYMLGGGYGFTSQIYGMNCDSAIEALVMLADGRIIVASEVSNPDLFWALRGGTGNNFGVLLQVTYQLYDPGPLWGFGVNWPLGRGSENTNLVATALETLQNGFTGENTPSGLSHQSAFNFVDDEPFLFLRGIYAGSPHEGKRLITPLLEAGGDLDIDIVGTYSSLNDYLGSHPDVPRVAPHTRTQADSRYTERWLSRTEWAQIAELFVRSPNQANFIGFEGYGGAIRAVDPAATAFRHRLALFDVFTWVFWQNDEERAASLAFLDEFREVMAPLSNGHAYQNYPNRANKHYRWMYWAENFTRLLEIKCKYDPDNFFSFGQTISPITTLEPSAVS
jgi:FAD/FMN-containing dehydrogenase